MPMDEPPATARASAAVADSSEFLTDPHRRHNPLIDEWVLVSPDRTNRPWQGLEAAPAVPPGVAFDPTCYLCPGNTRANGAVNPGYDRTFVFTNDFAALQPDSSSAVVTDGLLRAVGEPGTCRVLCYSPRHDLTMAGMEPADVRRIVDLWADETTELGARFGWVQVFENRGEAMGASNPHPHGQIWATSELPGEPTREDDGQRRYHAATDRRLLLDYAAQEHGGSRVVVENADWLVVVPFWAIWPFETLIIPRRSADRLADLDPPARDGLSEALIDLLRRYDRLFGQPFPYSMGWHQAPFDGQRRDHWQLHAHVYPPLLRATVRKFMVGYELLSESQRDISPEEAAERLRNASPPEPPPQDR
jgi:UDPglucose--hexose-1-phosphate uridylyltransferase